MLIQLIHGWRALGMTGLLAVALAVPAACSQESEPPEAGTADQEYGSQNGGESAAVAELAALPQPAAKHLSGLLDAYFQIGQTLASDKVEGLEPHAHEMAQAAEALAQTELPGAPNFWDEHGEEVQTVREQAEALAEASEIQEARVTYGVLSEALDELVKATGVPASYGKPVQGYVCGMFEEAPQGGVWLQVGEDVRNPYFGSEMLICRSEEYPLPVVGGGDIPGS